MKKVNYLWGGLMGLAVAASVTGCMQNEEPQGILALRESKSAYIDAETAFKKVDAEFRAVEVLQKKYAAMQDSIAVEQSKLALAKAQDSSEIDKLQYQQQLDTMAEHHKASMLELQAATIQAQKSYNTAKIALDIALATEQDEDVHAKLDGYKNNLGQANYAVTYAQKEYLKEQATYSNFLTKAEDFEALQTAVVESKKAELDIQKKVLADMEAMEVSNDYLADTQAAAKEIEELKTKVAKMKAELISFSDFQAQNLNEDQIKLTQEYQTLQQEWNFLDKEKTELDKVLIENQTYTVAKAGVTEKMIEDMKLDQVFPNSAPNIYFVDGKMVKDFDITAALNSMERSIDDYANQINSNLHNNSDDYTESEIIKVKSEMDRKKLDVELRKAEYDADVTEWVGAYKAFDAAVKAYDAYLVANPSIAELQKEIDAYARLDAKDQTVAKATELMKKIAAYDALHFALDGAANKISYTAAIAVGNATPVTNNNIKAYEYTIVEHKKYAADAADGSYAKDDDIAPGKKEMWIEDFNSTYINMMLTNATIKYNSSAAAKSAVKNYLDAENALFGTAHTETQYAYEPTADGKIPADIDGDKNTIDGTFGDYTKAVSALSIAENIDTYVAYVKTLRDAADKYAADVIAQNDKIAAKQDEKTAKNDEVAAKGDEINALQAVDSEYQKALNEYWLKEFEIMKLDTYDTHSGNPYSVTVTEMAVLEKKYTNLHDLQASGEVYYTKYVGGVYTVQYGSLANAISNQELNIKNNEEPAYDLALQTLTDFQTYGKIDYEYKATLEKSVADAKAKLDAATELVTYYNGMITKLLSAFAE